MDYDSIAVPYKSFVTKISQEQGLKSYYEAMKDSRWIKAMSSEIQALEENHTWEIVQLPEDKKAIGCKWVYKIKYNANGEVDRFKADCLPRDTTRRRA